MSTFMSENFLKIVSLVLTVLAILGSIVQFQSFKIELHGKQLDRQYIMFGQYLVGAPFITDDSTGYTKGLLSEMKLDSFDRNSFDDQFNFPQIEKYYVEIIVSGAIRWIFGDDGLKSEKHMLWEYPVAINMDNTVMPAKMMVYVPKVE